METDQQYLVATISIILCICSLMNLRYDEYVVSWICSSRHVQMSKEMFDNGFRSLLSTNSKYDYFGGQMSGINIVIAAAPDGDDAAMAGMEADMLQRFPNIRFRLLVGIGGASPKIPALTATEDDIRLGDVVIGYVKGAGRFGGALHYTATDSSFSVTSHLKPPPRVVLDAVDQSRFNYASKAKGLNGYVEKLTAIFGSHYPGQEYDRLYKPGCVHVRGCKTCSDCDEEWEERAQRTSTLPVLHCGLIASGRYDMQDAKRRNTLRHEEDICCFDEEAAGQTDEFPSLMIRGICDYSDSHKNKNSNKNWQAYAATAATAYARYLMGAIKATDVASLTPYRSTKPRNETLQKEVPKASNKHEQAPPQPTPPQVARPSPLPASPLPAPSIPSLLSTYVPFAPPPTIPSPAKSPGTICPQCQNKGINNVTPPQTGFHPNAQPTGPNLHQRCRIGILYAEDVDRQLLGPQCQNLRNDLRWVIGTMVQGLGGDFTACIQTYRNFIVGYQLRSEGIINVGQFETAFDGMSTAEAALVACSMQTPDLVRLRAARAYLFLSMSCTRQPVVFAIYDTILRLWEYVEGRKF
ncbi:uncharacterized protein F4807DRAFT_391807 [Annulohypoxylon truncatum]|uniref:uncharacterized protein n=1 Tax=Annulohypoxylon truncatum TaxID=327061 RepID=UPI002007687B|nr:uncharacterized protein F4807DRAFT_391807 [Annulohypoxylon truncatum]KAI1211517.1 hypothetical protein F4807DRAFT_391807 [Annulohypoxylon truncatum]